MASRNPHGNEPTLPAAGRTAPEPRAPGAGVAVVRAEHLTRELGGTGGLTHTVLSNVSLSVPRGQFLALTGASGSGKSTLLYLLGVLDRPTSGRVLIDGVEVSSLDDDGRAEFRNERLGFVFQFHFLLPEFNVLENVTLPMRRRGRLSVSEAEDRAMTTLRVLGLEELTKRRPSQLSGGQQQRVSIARAVANDPLVLLADEPTGNLDSRSAAIVFEVFAALAREEHRTVIMVTHDVGLALRCDRRIVLQDGELIEDVWQGAGDEERRA